jgi:hypothetical protein
VSGSVLLAIRGLLPVFTAGHVFEAGSARRRGDQIGTLAAGGMQHLAVPQAPPSLRHVEVAPLGEIGVLALEGDPGKCAMPLGEIRRKEALAAVSAPVG